ncbi:MAG: ribonuclease P protein component [Actinomycetota bacterium]|nr:ribonuclease P protein component [Actinomycetota bacterium]
MSATVAPASIPAAPRPQLWRITDRRSFQELRRHGRRARRGPLTVTFLADASPQPRVGFAVGKTAGGAVTRNRIRRRLRAALRELLAAGRLPTGTYLVGAGAAVAPMPWTELVALVEDAVASVAGAEPR